jgi:hypothetical protein
VIGLSRHASDPSGRHSDGERRFTGCAGQRRRCTP